MNIDRVFFYLNFSALLCGVPSLVFGIVQRLRNKYGLYYDIGLMALGTLTLGFLFRFVNMLCGGKTTGFSLGYLAMIGSLLFFFSTNRSYISVLEDAPTKYRHRSAIFAWIMPILLLSCLVLIYIKTGFTLSLIPVILLCATAGLSSYFSFREVLLPDVKNGFIDCMRPFNALVCLLSLLCVAMEVMFVFGAPILAFIAIGVMGDIMVLLLSLFLYTGVRKWRT